MERLPPSQRRAIAKMLRVAQVFRAVDPHITTQLVRTFLAVANEEGLTGTEYAKRSGVAQSVASRHLHDLGELNRRHGAGLALVSAATDIYDRRRRLFFVSPRGHAVLKRLGFALGTSESAKSVRR